MMTAQPSLFERTAPDPHEHPYFGWALNAKDPHPEETATAAFVRRYGRAPEFVIDSIGNNLLLGPIPEAR